MSGVVVGRKRCRLTAAIYVRRSSADSENTEADAFCRSLAAQERECLAWAERQGLNYSLRRMGRATATGAAPSGWDGALRCLFVLL
jgi:ferric-dicitrate binding protein FerR (iron transport regulator)